MREARGIKEAYVHLFVLTNTHTEGQIRAQYGRLPSKRGAGAGWQEFGRELEFSDYTFLGSFEFGEYVNILHN